VQQTENVKMGRIPKDQRASLHVSKTTRDRIMFCLTTLIGERNQLVTADDVVNEMAECFEAKRSRKK
jgi:hypothetical protein